MLQNLNGMKQTTLVFAAFFLTLLAHGQTLRGGLQIQLSPDTIAVNVILDNSRMREGCVANMELWVGNDSLHKQVKTVVNGGTDSVTLNVRLDSTVYIVGRSRIMCDNVPVGNTQQRLTLPIVLYVPVSFPSVAVQPSTASTSGYAVTFTTQNSQDFPYYTTQYSLDGTTWVDNPTPIANNGSTTYSQPVLLLTGLFFSFKRFKLQSRRNKIGLLLLCVALLLVGCQKDVFPYIKPKGGKPPLDKFYARVVAHCKWGNTMYSPVVSNKP